MVFVSPVLLPSIYRIGYAPCQYSKRSDHRPLLIEFNTRHLFGYNISIPAASSPLLKTKDKAAVTNFITKWFRYISDNGGFSCQRQLDDDSSTPELVEHIDTIIGIGGKKAERSCRRRRPEFYSREIILQRIRVSILRHHLHSLRKGVDRSNQLSIRMQRFGLDIPLPLTIRLAKEMLSIACQKMKELRQSHEDLRQQELAAKIDQALESGKKTSAHILHAIKVAEANQRTHQILRNIKQRSSHTQKIDRVEIPSSWPPPVTPLDTIFEVSVLKRHLNNLNQDHDRTTQLLTRMEQVGIHVHLPPTPQLTRKALQEARTRLQTTCLHSFEMRQAELDQKIQELSDQRKKPKQRIIRAIKKVEVNLKTFKTLQAIKRSTAGQSSFDRIEIPASWPPSDIHNPHNWIRSTRGPPHLHRVETHHRPERN